MNTLDNGKIKAALKAAGLDSSEFHHNNRYMDNNASVDAVSLIVRLKEAIEEIADRYKLPSDEKTNRGEYISDLVSAADRFLVDDNDFFFDEELYGDQPLPEPYSIRKSEVDIRKTVRCSHCGEIITRQESYDGPDGSVLCSRCDGEYAELQRAREEMKEAEDAWKASEGKRLPSAQNAA